MRTRQEFEADLESLRRRLLEMGTTADSMLGDAMQALAEQNVELAESVIASDDRMDDMDLAIEGDCLRLIAIQQPVSRDLRLVGTAFKAITDLERIGDHAVDIAKAARRLARQEFYKPLVDLPRLCGMVREMLRDVLTAFVNHDLTLADRVIEADDRIDDLYHQLRAELHEGMQKDPTVVVQASQFLFVAHWLERIADHAVNIAERVYYTETGDLAQLARSHHAESN